MSNDKKHYPKSNEQKQIEKDANRDPLSGRAGSHVVGAGVGAAGGVVAGVAAGAAVGTIAGPLGTAVGATIGGVVGGVGGGLTGKAIAEHVDPTVEHGYWREHYANRPYIRVGGTYEEYGPAYQYGWESHARHHDKTFEEAEPILKRDWLRLRGVSKMEWDHAREPARDSWNRMAHKPGGSNNPKKTADAKMASSARTATGPLL